MNRKTKTNNVRAGLIALGFMGILAVGCNKYDKMSIVGTWDIDLKAAQNLQVDSSKETLYFNSGTDHTYTQSVFERNKTLQKWSISGNFERKNNKITFTNRIKDGTTPEGDLTYKYRVEDDKFILIIPNAGFANDEKIYTKR
ncbi:MAG: hypothetical protein LBQ64_04805 [Bacteroidales bacterium]|jgi:hypothetical protein|nr:hypothetical protein [Bacteroidales bacterium]